MKKILFALGLAIAVAMPAFCFQAREVTFTTELQNYRGDGAYVVLYLTDASEPIRARSGWPVRNPNTTST